MGHGRSGARRVVGGLVGYSANGASRILPLRAPRMSVGVLTPSQSSNWQTTPGRGQTLTLVGWPRVIVAGALL